MRALCDERRLAIGRNWNEGKKRVFVRDVFLHFKATMLLKIKESESDYSKSGAL